MLNAHIVTDSYAHFANPHNVQQMPLTIVPNQITIGGKVYREGLDITAEKALRLIEKELRPPVITPPSVAEYLETYLRLAQTHKVILSIHASRELSQSWHNAREAANQMGGSCEIVVIDSQTLCAGQGMLVKAAAKALPLHTNADSLIQAVRGTVERLYSVFYVESIDYLLQNQLLSASHTILGMMLGVKPLLTLEAGLLKPIEKVRTRTQAVERMIEFLVEFEDVEDTVIIQNKVNMTESTRMLQDRLSLEFSGQYFPYSIYSASLAALLGTDVFGLVILEQEMDGI